MLDFSHISWRDLWRCLWGLFEASPKNTVEPHFAYTTGRKAHQPNELRGSSHRAHTAFTASLPALVGKVRSNYLWQFSMNHKILLVLEIPLKFLKIQMTLKYRCLPTPRSVIYCYIPFRKIRYYVGGATPTLLRLYLYTLGGHIVLI